jgi:hypothetical protein
LNGRNVMPNEQRRKTARKILVKQDAHLA